jgi:hypothetical protein
MNREGLWFEPERPTIAQSATRGRARGGRLVGWHLLCTEEQPGFESPPLHQDRRLLGPVDGEYAGSRIDELKTREKGIGQVVGLG